MLSFEDWFSRRHANLPVASAKAVLALTEGGATLPFIARYRKEQTGNLDEVAIQSVLEAKETWDAVVHRKKIVCDEIEKQGKLTPELKERILATYDLERLEDLYLPYKLKRKTKATVAREAGLEPLAGWMWRVSHEETAEAVSLVEKAAGFLSPEKNVTTTDQAIDGARDIVTERLSENADLREHVRRALFDAGFVRSNKGDKAKPNSKYERYFSFHERVSSLLRPEASHRYLAMRRGFLEEELVLSIGAASARAWADPTDQDKALATSLYDEGRALFSQNKVSEACRKLEESQRLVPAHGTLLNLAACHEREGLAASAMAEFREARELAERDHDSDRVAFADEHLKALA
ncbi:MAG: Tex-like N-terminal domain-containing protein, partial [Polyangiaceae bacterium]